MLTEDGVSCDGGSSEQMGWGGTLIPVVVGVGLYVSWCRRHPRSFLVFGGRGAVGLATTTMKRQMML